MRISTTARLVISVMQRVSNLSRLCLPRPQERYFALTDQGNLALYSSEAMKDKPKTFPIKEADIMLDANDTHGAMLINKAEEICVYFGPREKPAVTKTAMTADQKKAAMTAAVTGTPRSRGGDAWKDDKRLPKIDDFGRNKDDPAYGKGCQDLEPILRKIRPKAKSRRSSQAAVSKKEPEPEPESEANWLWDTMADFVWSAMSVHGCKMGPMRNDEFNVECAQDNPLVLDRLEGFTAQEVTYKHAWEPDSDEDSDEEQVDPGPQLMLEQCPKGCSVRKYGPRAKKAAKGEPGMQVGLLVKTVNKKPVQCFRPEMVKHVFKTEQLPLKLVLATQLKEDVSSSDEEESSEEESSEDDDKE